MRVSALRESTPTQIRVALRALDRVSPRFNAVVVGRIAIDRMDMLSWVAAKILGREFDMDSWALDSKVSGFSFGDRARPSEPSLVEATLDFFHLFRRRRFMRDPGPFADQIEQKDSLIA